MAEDELCVRVTFRVTDTIRNYIKRSFVLIFLFRKQSKLKQLRNVLQISHPRTCIVPAYVVPYLKSLFPQTHNIKPRAQFFRYDVEDIFEFLNFHDQELTFDVLFQIRK